MVSVFSYIYLLWLFAPMTIWIYFNYMQINVFYYWVTELEINSVFILTLIFQIFCKELALFFLSSPEDMLIDFREKGRGRETERNIDMRERHLLFAFCTLPHQGPNPNWDMYPNWELNPWPFSLWDKTPSKWVTLARDELA